MTIVQQLLDVLRLATKPSASLFERIEGLAAVAELQSRPKLRRALDDQAKREVKLRIKLVKLFNAKLGVEWTVRQELNRVSADISTDCGMQGGYPTGRERASVQLDQRSMCSLVAKGPGSKARIPITFNEWRLSVDEHGLLRGMPVKQSALFRDFCRSCGSPIRIISKRLVKLNFCERCQGRALQGKTAPPGVGATLPSWDNAIRAIEDAC